MLAAAFCCRRRRAARRNSSGWRGHEQAAIYEYGVRDGKLYRTVVVRRAAADAPEAMEVVPPPDTAGASARAAVSRSP